MTTPPFSDDAVERILRDFFAREMPAELQALPDRPTGPVDKPLSTVAAGRPRRWSHWKTGLASIALAASGVLIAVAVVRNDAKETPEIVGPTGDRSDTARDSSEMARSTDDVPSNDVGTTGTPEEPPLIIVDDSANAGRRRPADRREPVEARASRQWTTLGEAGDEPESKTDYSVPNEISVEILPLEGDPVEPRTPPQPPGDTRLPEERRSND